MIRWRTCLVLTLLLLIPLVSGKEDKDDDDEDRNDDNNEEEDEEEEDEDDDDQDDDKKSPHGGGGGGRRAPPILGSPKSLLSVSAQRPMHKTLEPRKKPALECYVCAYKAETPLRACLDPTKFRVHTITCHSAEDKCFTSVISHGNTYDAVIRGCRSGCIGTPETTCCEASRCNNQAFAMPVPASHIMKEQKEDKLVVRSSAPGQPTVLFFVTILLILQTVVKVTIV